MSKLRLSDLTMTKPDLVTLVQYHRSLYVYTPGDPRISERVTWIRALEDTQRSATMFLPEGYRQRRLQELDLRQIEVTEDVDYKRLTSEEVQVDMMDALMDVHDFSHGKSCC